MRVEWEALEAIIVSLVKGLARSLQRGEFLTYRRLVARGGRTQDNSALRTTADSNLNWSARPGERRGNCRRGKCRGRQLCLSHCLSHCVSH